MAREKLMKFNNSEIKVADTRQHIVCFCKYENINDYICQCLPEQMQPVWRDYRRKWDMADKAKIITDFPLEIDLETTDNCNLRCIHCYQRHRTLPRKPPITMETVKEIIDEGSECGLSCLVVGSTDEPLLHKQVFEILSYAKESKIPDLWFFSNANLINRDIARKLIDIQPTRISISIDAFSDEVYSKVRGGNLQLVREALNYLLEERRKQHKKLPVFRVTFIRQQVNLHEMDSFLNYWKNLVEQVDFQVLFDTREVEKLPHDTAEEDFECSHPWKYIQILSNGDVLPCCDDFGRHLCIGNVNDMSIRQMWHSQKINQLRDSFNNKKYLKPCINCLGYRPKWVNG